MTDETMGRRGFLKAAVGGVLAIAGLKMVRSAQASEPEGRSPHSWAMVIDQALCTGCGHCTLTCRAHNDINPDIAWNRVIVAGEVGGKTVYLSRPCMHCEKPPCAEVCPVGATYHRPDGIIMMDYDKCIGCRYCEVALTEHGHSTGRPSRDPTRPFPAGGSRRWLGARAVCPRSARSAISASIAVWGSACCLELTRRLRRPALWPAR
jgi:ferredoxin